MEEMTPTSAMDLFLGWYLDAKFMGIALPDLAKFIGFILAGLVLGRLLRYPIARWIKKVTTQEEGQAGVKIAQGIESSVFLLVFSIVLKSGAVDVLHLPGWIWEKTRDGTTILLAAAATALFLQIVELFLLGLRKRWYDNNSQIDESLLNFLRKGIRLFVILLAVLVTADNINFKITGIIAGLGIGGAALALGAQGLIANLLGTVEVVADRLYRVGDRIQFDAFDGFVVEVGLRSTKIRALTGEQIRVPNKRMAEVQILNFSRNSLVRTIVMVRIVYSTSHDRLHEAIRILEGIFIARQDVDSHQIYLKNLGPHSLELEVIFWARYSTSLEYNALIGEIHMEIKKAFDSKGIEFALPTQTLHLADGRKPLSGSSRN